MVTNVVNNLQRTFKYISIPQGYVQVLDEEQIDQVNRVAIRLATALIKYLSEATSKLCSAQLGRYLWMMLILVRTQWNEILGGDSLSVVRGRILQYNNEVGILRARNQGALARSQYRQDILEWLCPVPSWGRHDNYHDRRIEGIGRSFLDSRVFRQWSSGSGPSNLVCPGPSNFTRN